MFAILKIQGKAKIRTESPKTIAGQLAQDPDW